MSNHPSVYECIECKQHYCTNCDPGEDACDVCRLGPYCPECSVEHASEHSSEPGNDDGDRDDGPEEWTESPAGERARERWAKHFDDLNGAPEDDNDR